MSKADLNTKVECFLVIAFVKQKKLEENKSLVKQKAS
mgnify:CR=1 FL=1